MCIVEFLSTEPYARMSIRTCLFASRLGGGGGEKSIFIDIQWVPGALSPGVKRPGREADHSFPSSAEVKE
jgi:hypothetical protein